MFLGIRAIAMSGIRDIEHLACRIRFRILTTILGPSFGEGFPKLPR